MDILIQSLWLVVFLLNLQFLPTRGADSAGLGGTGHRLWLTEDTNFRTVWQPVYCYSWERSRSLTACGSITWAQDAFSRLCDFYPWRLRPCKHQQNVMHVHEKMERPWIGIEQATGLSSTQIPFFLFIKFEVQRTELYAPSCKAEGKRNKICSFSHRPSVSHIVSGGLCPLGRRWGSQQVLCTPRADWAN